MVETISRRTAIIGGVVALVVIGGLVAALVVSGNDGGSQAQVTTTSTADGSATTAPTDSSTTSTPVSTTDPGTGERPENIDGSLRQLGVDTTPTARVAADQEPLPDDYSPLGSSPDLGDPAEGSSESGLNQTDELFIVGLELAATSSTVSLVEQEGVQIDGAGNIDPGETVVLEEWEPGEPSWAVNADARAGDSDDTRRLRAVVGGDVDGDGFEEIVTVYVDTSAADRVLRLRISEPDEGFSEVDISLGDGDEVRDVAAVTGDFDGDGTSQIAVGLGFDDRAEIRVLDPDGDGSGPIVYPLNFETPIVTVELAVGNLDYDNPDELAVVVNEFDDPDGPGVLGAASLFVHDDATAGFELLDSSPVQGRDGAVVTAVVGDVDIGDVDGDGLGEIVIGGLTEFRTSCDPYEAFVAVRDDAEHALADLDTDTFDAFFSNCPAFGPWRLRFLHVGTFDLDGDGIDEIHGNLRVYEDLAATPELSLIHELPQEVLVERDGDAGARISSATTVFSSGDVTGDGRENLIVYAQWQERGVGIWGLSAIETVGFAELSTLQVTSRYNTQDRVEPVILPVNVDADSPLLKYSDGEYVLAFTEPLVIAVMAAAPCGDDIGQNIAACSTAFGQGESTTVDAELTVTVKAGVHVGVESEAKLPIVGGVSGSLKESVTVTASISAGTAYTVEKSRTFTTGPFEDGVVFTTIPYDRYTYTIVSHPDPELVGGTVVVSLPREPIVLKVEREFYNAGIVEAAFPIDDRIFQHVVGDVGSYPTAGAKNETLRQFGGLQNGPISVGQGGGSSALEIAVSTEVSLGGTLGIEYEREAEVTAGPAMTGYTVGYGAQASLTVTSGSQTTYSVEVGDLTSADFATNQYSYGIFTYVQEVGGQEFEVINFWIE
jgi:hypothetical protein